MKFPFLFFFFSLWLIFLTPGVFAKQGFTIKRVVAGFDQAEASKNQLLETLVKNANFKGKRLTVKMVVSNLSGDPIFERVQTKFVPGYTEKNFIFSMPIKRNLYGFFYVRSYLYDSRQVILYDSSASSGRTVSFVTKGYQGYRPKTDDLPDQAIQASKPEEKEGNILGDIRPDLLVQDLEFSKSAILRGGTIEVSLQVKNSGGNIAQNVRWNLHILGEYQLDNRLGKPDHSEIIDILAPGESKKFLIPVYIDPKKPIGKYYAVGNADPEDEISENSESNNLVRSGEYFQFSDIILLTPESEITVDMSKGTTFSWDSTNYNLFYLQISPDESFTNPNAIVQIPKGNPYAKKSLTTIAGEELISLINLRRSSENQDRFYWRVLGFDQNNRQSFSYTDFFYIYR